MNSLAASDMDVLKLKDNKTEIRHENVAKLAD